MLLRSLYGQLHGMHCTGLVHAVAALPGPELPQIGWAPVGCLTWGVRFGPELAQYTGEAQGVVLGPPYVTGASAYESGQGVKVYLDRHLVHVRKGAHILEKRYLCKLGKEGDLLQITCAAPLPFVELHVTPSLVQPHREPLRAREVSVSVALPAVPGALRVGYKKQAGLLSRLQRGQM
jgi:hypothetical protein